MNAEETLRAYKDRLEAYLDALPLSGAPEKLRDRILPRRPFRRAPAWNSR